VRDDARRGGPNDSGEALGRRGFVLPQTSRSCDGVAALEWRPPCRRQGRVASRPSSGYGPEVSTSGANLCSLNEWKSRSARSVQGGHRLSDVLCPSAMGRPDRPGMPHPPLSGFETLTPVFCSTATRATSSPARPTALRRRLPRPGGYEARSRRPECKRVQGQALRDRPRGSMPSSDRTLSSHRRS
jgi:hypothetical protein